MSLQQIDREQVLFSFSVQMNNLNTIILKNLKTQIHSLINNPPSKLYSFFLTIQPFSQNAYLRYALLYMDSKTGNKQLYNISMTKVLAQSRKTSYSFKDNFSQTSDESGGLLEKNDLHHDQFEIKCSQSFNSKAKSSLCKNFMEKGSCPYGHKCQFAHGPSELKCNIQNQMSYKTRLCHSFTRKGFCCYGSRCNFLHKDLESQKLEGIWEYREILYESRKKQHSRTLKILGSN